MKLRDYLARLRQRDKDLSLPPPKKRFIAFVRTIADDNGVLIFSKAENFYVMKSINRDWRKFLERNVYSERYVVVTIRPKPHEVEFSTGFKIHPDEIPLNIT